MAGGYQRLERGIGVRVPALIIGGWLGGCAVAAANHFLFNWLHGQEPYNELEFAHMHVLLTPEKESAVANTLADIAKILFGTSILTSLAQGMWQTARRRKLPLRQLDYIFGLPNPIKILRILFSRYVRMLFPLILVSASVYTLMIITILAPGSLVVGESNGWQSHIWVPTVNLSAPPGQQVLIEPDSGDTQPSLLMDYDVAIAISDANYGWYPPRRCGAACKYTFTYLAPALSCTDLSEDQISDQTEDNPNSFPAQLRHWRLGTDDEDPEGDEVFIYNGTSNLPSPGESKDVSEPYTFTVAMLPSDDHAIGAACTFYNATYKVQAAFGTGDDYLYPIINITERHNNLSDPWAQPHNPCPWTYNGTGNPTEMTFPPCMTQGVNARAMVLGFTNYMRGTMQWLTNELYNTTAYLSPVLYVDSDDLDLELNNPNITLGQSLEQLMQQVTLASVYRNTSATRVEAVVDINDSIYKYNPTRFWAAYGSAILVTALCGVYGFVCLVSNGGPGHLDLSHLMATSQSPGMAQLALTDEHNVVPDDMRRLVLAFGEVEVGEKGSERILAFGVVGQDDIKRRRPFSERHPSFGSTHLDG